MQVKSEHSHQYIVVIQSMLPVYLSSVFIITILSFHNVISTVKYKP